MQVLSSVVISTLSPLGQVEIAYSQDNYLPQIIPTKDVLGETVKYISKLLGISEKLVLSGSSGLDLFIVGVYNYTDGDNDFAEVVYGVALPEKTKLHDQYLKWIPINQLKLSDHSQRILYDFGHAKTVAVDLTVKYIENAENLKRDF